jgi:hypothetical protein
MSSISTVILRNKWQWLFYTKSLTATVLIHSQWRWLGFLYTASNGECFMQSHCRRPFSIQSQWRRLFLHNKHIILHVNHGCLELIKMSILVKQKQKRLDIYIFELFSLSHNINMDCKWDTRLSIFNKASLNNCSQYFINSLIYLDLRVSNTSDKFLRVRSFKWMLYKCLFDKHFIITFKLFVLPIFNECTRWELLPLLVWYAPHYHF